MKTPVQNLRNIAETLDGSTFVAIEELEHLMYALCLEDWEVLTGFVKEVRPMVLMKLNNDWAE